MKKNSINYEGAERRLNPEAAGVKVRRSFYSVVVKRLLDIVISLLALVVSLPFNLVIGIVTIFDVGSPIFFRQQRVGKDMKLFTITKFRNMRNTYDENGELLPPEERVTPFGRIVRKTSLDELLNFWSILKGDMSLIGPRPLLIEYVPYYSERQLMRHGVRPGLECPSLVKRDHTRTWDEQFEDDVWYVEHVSFITDCRMIFALVKLVFDKNELKRRSGALRGRFDDLCRQRIAREEQAQQPSENGNSDGEHNDVE